MARFPCFGKADNAAAKIQGNVSRDPERPFGDTPIRGYKVMELLHPQSGQALVAKINGRTGLMIHGGAPSATGGLRPTHSCVRLSDANQSTLLATIAPVPLASVAVTVTEV